MIWKESAHPHSFSAHFLSFSFVLVSSDLQYVHRNHDQNTCMGSGLGLLQSITYPVSTRKDDTGLRSSWKWKTVVLGGNVVGEPCGLGWEVGG